MQSRIIIYSLFVVVSDIADIRAIVSETEWTQKY